MLGLLWLLAAVEGLGLPLSTSYPLSTWISFLKSIDSNLPLLTVAADKICYYVDVSQTCAGEAIGDLLSQAAVANPKTWTPTTDECDSLLDEQRVYAEKVASSVFSAAIENAAIATVTDFEILAQSWVLRAGYHALTYTHAAFVTAINGITDWTLVHCDATNFLYDSTTMVKPDFFKAKDCDILDLFYTPPPPNCSNMSCPLSDGLACCKISTFGLCCTIHYTTFISSCNTAGCPYNDFCCSQASTSACCV